MNAQSERLEHPDVLELCTQSESETRNVGATLARWLLAGDVILLYGDLGAGKTVLAQGIARGLQIEVPITSPSFALVNEYDMPPDASGGHLYHLDLYRLDTLDELETIGFTDIINASTAVTLIEWPERALGALPERYLLLEISARQEGTRELTISAQPDDETWRQRLNELKRLVQQSQDAGDAP